MIFNRDYVEKTLVNLEEVFRKLGCDTWLCSVDDGEIDVQADLDIVLYVGVYNSYDWSFAIYFKDGKLVINNIKGVLK